MNTCNFTGRLTKDPEVKKLDNDKTIATFTLAVNDFKDTDFIPCKAWNKTAETIAQYLGKGALIGVTGKLKSRSYETQNGDKRTAYEVMVTSFDFLDKKETPSAADVPPEAPAIDQDLSSYSDTDVNSLPFTI